MADISFTNLTNLPPDIATQYEEIARRKKIQEALMGQTLQQPKTQYGKSGRYSVAVPYSPLEGATKLIQAAMLSKGAGRTDQALNQLGQKYRTGGQEAVGDVMSMARGRPATVPQYDGVGPNAPAVAPDVPGAITMGAGSDWPQAQRVSGALLDQQTVGRGRGEYVIDGELWDAESKQMVPVLFNRRVPQGHPLSVTHLDGSPVPARMLSPKGPQAQGSIAGAKTTGTGMAERGLDKPTEQAGVESQQRKQVFVSDLIKEAKDDAGYFTSGFIGKIGSFIAGTPQYDLSQKLATIKANLGFDKLQEMRDASKTGGALGQISNREIDFLQSVWSSVEQGQSPGELKKNLTRVDAAMDAVVNGKVDKFNRLYPSSPYPGGSSGSSFDDADKERRYQEWKSRQ